MNGYFDKYYTIHSFECDENFKIKISSIVDFLQDIAIYHSDDRGCGFKEMKEMGLAWILYKWKIRVYERPLFGDTICVRTWSAGIEKRTAYRCFRIFDKNGKVICEASSVWLVLDINKRSITPITTEIINKYINLDEYVLKDIFTNNPLSLAGNQISNSYYTVRRHDLDYNLHMNNAKYIEILFDTLPVDFLNNKTFYDLEIIYKKECILENKLECICYDSPRLNNESGCSVDKDHLNVSEYSNELYNQNEKNITVISVIKQLDTENNRHANVFFKLDSGII